MTLIVIMILVGGYFLMGNFDSFIEKYVKDDE